MERHCRQRESLVSLKLHLPSRLFQDAHVLEFGQDTAENALVFAKWGAELTLVEPNRRAHPYIREYFARFGLRRSLRHLRGTALENFDTEDSVDFIDAEGFVYTIQPASRWLDRFAALLRPGGLAIISYLEISGCLFKLSHRLAHARVKALTGKAPEMVAKTLLRKKWSSVPQTQSLDAWTLDVLENPFVRAAYAFQAPQFVEDLARRGFRLWSSWPRYEDGLDNYWHKQKLEAAEEVRRLKRNLNRNCLSYALEPPANLADVAVARNRNIVERREGPASGREEGRTADGSAGTRD